MGGRSQVELDTKPQKSLVAYVSVHIICFAVRKNILLTSTDCYDPKESFKYHFMNIEVVEKFFEAAGAGTFG